MRPAKIILAGFGIALMLAACDDGAPAIKSKVPAEIDRGNDFVYFFDPAPDAQQGLDRLAANDRVLIRPAGPPFTTAELIDIKEDVRLLLARGVATARISFVGRGEEARQAVWQLAALIQLPGMTFVTIGGCADAEAGADPFVGAYSRFRGRILSVVPAGSAPSCQENLARMTNAETWEIEVAGTAAEDWYQDVNDWIDDAH